jgi:hypothetical protein
VANKYGAITDTYSLSTGAASERLCHNSFSTVTSTWWPDVARTMRSSAKVARNRTRNAHLAKWFRRNGVITRAANDNATAPAYIAAGRTE